MSRRTNPDDHVEESSDPDDPDAPQACDLSNDDEDDDETPTVPCSACRRDVPDFADRCPYCGEWIVQSAGTAARGDWWPVIVLLVLVALLILWGLL